MNATEATTRVVPVLVVGAGPTGVSVATMLAQRGVRTLVVDRQDGIYPLPRAVHLDDEIYRVLQGIGAADDFAAITMPTSGMRLLDANHRTMAEFRRSAPIGEHGYPQANMFDQPELEQVLRRALGRQPLASIEQGLELVAVDQASAGPARVRVTLRPRDGGPDRVIWCDAVLGCDGANSTVRSLLGISLEDLHFEERWLVVDLSSDAQLPAWHGVHQVCDPRRAATFMQVGPTRYRWEFRLRADESADNLMATDRLAELVRPWLGDVPFESLAVQRRAEYTFRARIARRWRDGRVFLLGDAAHLTPPFIGQGLCAGLRDAANLSWKLAAVLDGADESLLDTYEAERAPHARALIRKAVLIGRVMTGGQDMAAHVRRAVLAVLCRIPGFTDRALDSRPPRFPAGPLVRRGGRRDRLSGRLSPQPRVTTGALTLPLDDLLGDGYAIVTLGRPDRHLSAMCAHMRTPLISVVDGTEAAAPAGSVPAPPVVVSAARNPDLASWLRDHACAAALLRPDRVVAAAEAVGIGHDRTVGASLAPVLRDLPRLHPTPDIDAATADDASQARGLAS